MFKKIKKSLKYIIILIGIIIILPTIFYLVLQIPEVQTFLVKRISGHFSDQINSTISVGKIEYRFFNRLSASDILLKDKNNDTLLYSKNTIIGFKKIDFKNRSLRLGRVILVKPVFALITDSSGSMNLTWYLNLFKKQSDSTNKNKINLIIDQIDISDASFSYVKKSSIPSKTKIDFNNLKLTSINGILEDLKIINDTITFNIYNLGFHESSGFQVKRMSSSVVLSKLSYLLKSASFSCDSSIFNISRFGMISDSSSSFKNFTEEVKLDILLEKSLISTSDLQYFIPALSGINESGTISGKILGTISELRGRNIALSFRDHTSISCDFDLSGLPSIENTFIYIGVNSLKTNAEDFKYFKLPGKDSLIISDIFYKLGNVTFNGSFTGFTTDFVTYGEIRTSQGNFRTDISLRPDESKKYRIKGLLIGKDINLGELTGKKDMFGKLNMQSNVDGYAYSFKKFETNLTGKIDSIEINRYKYRNMTLNGVFTEKTWDGSINIEDENIRLSLMGLLNFKEKLPEFDFTLNVVNANLYKLNIDKLDTTSSLTMLLTSNFKGSSIDNLDGEIKLLNSSFIKYGKNLELNDFLIRTFTENNKPVLSLQTDFVNAKITGYYNFSTLNRLIKSTMATLMPSQYPDEIKQSELKKNNFNFEINFKKTNKINEFFRTGFLLSDNSDFKGAVFPDSVIKIEGTAKSLTVRKSQFSDFHLDANVSGSELFMNVTSSSLKLIGQSEIKNFSLNINTKPDNFVFKLEWDDKEENINHGNFIARGKIAKRISGKENGNAILTIDIDSTDIYSRSKLWKISQSTIRIDSNSINVNKLRVKYDNNYYLINGTVSEDLSDTLHLEFNGIDISPLNYFINRNTARDTNAVALNFKGRINGKILVTNVYKNLMVESNIVVNDFSLLGSEFGSISLLSVYDINRKVALIKAENNQAGVKKLDIEGYYDPALKRIDLNAIASNVKIDALNPLLKIFASGIDGTVTGKLNLSGEPGKIILKGAVMAENSSITINYLQTKYNLNDSVLFDKRGIKFNNLKITDPEGNIATLSGSVDHKNFREYSADLIINTNKFLVLNTKQKDNQMFYGTVYATGVTTIKSIGNSVSFDISARTDNNTKFFIPLNKSLSVSENSFITFINTQTVKDSINRINKTEAVSSAQKQSRMDVNIDLEVTPEAEVQIIFDSKVGDKMTGHGSGNLNINLNRKRDLRISGDYVIEDGEYLFTLGNLLNKRFYVENGGRIMFSGDIYNAEIELRAIYKNLRTSLYPILPFDPKYNDRIAVEPVLNLSGKLFNPNVKFDINLPSADEETRALVKNALSSEEEINRQFLYLLVMNSFIYQSTATATATGTSAMAVTTTEMITNQLSNWISQISNDFDLGFVYRPGSGNKDINPQELQVAMSTQILNDKVSINGNFDIRGAANNTNNTDQLTGDFDAEIKITEKIRFKVFNRFNDISTGKGPYTQGIGILFKKDFNKFSDLFGKKVKTDMKKEEEPTIKN